VELRDIEGWKNRIELRRARVSKVINNCKVLKMKILKVNIDCSARKRKKNRWWQEMEKNLEEKSIKGRNFKNCFWDQTYIYMKNNKLGCRIKIMNFRSCLGSTKWETSIRLIISYEQKSEDKNKGRKKVVKKKWKYFIYVCLLRFSWINEF
jgi:hypothetical protein